LQASEGSMFESATSMIQRKPLTLFICVRRVRRPGNNTRSNIVATMRFFRGIRKNSGPIHSYM
jgi:hypothetical protein